MAMKNWFFPFIRGKRVHQIHFDSSPNENYYLFFAKRFSVSFYINLWLELILKCDLLTTGVEMKEKMKEKTISFLVQISFNFLIFQKYLKSRVYSCCLCECCVVNWMACIYAFILKLDLENVVNVSFSVSLEWTTFSDVRK